jgi:hypothetical protein
MAFTVERKPYPPSTLTVLDGKKAVPVPTPAPAPKAKAAPAKKAKKGRKK